MKIDVEGAEAAVLRGMRRTLREHHPVLIVEIHEGQDAIVRDLLTELATGSPFWTMGACRI